MPTLPGSLRKRQQTNRSTSSLLSESIKAANDSNQYELLVARKSCPRSASNGTGRCRSRQYLFNGVFLTSLSGIVGGLCWMRHTGFVTSVVVRIEIVVFLMRQSAVRKRI